MIVKPIHENNKAKKIIFILNSLLFAWYQYAATSSFLYHICKKNSGIKVEKRRKYCSLTRTSYLQKNTP
jgi:hypothetical protein